MGFCRVSIFVGVLVVVNACSFPTAEEAAIRYSTQPAFQITEEIGKHQRENGCG